MSGTQQRDDDIYPTTTDVSAQRIARVYAEALLNAAEKRGQVEGVLDDLEALVRDVFQREPQLEAILASGAIGRGHKRRLIERAFAGRADDVFITFLLVLNEHERLDLVRPILVAARALRDERAQKVRVEVQSAVPLPDDQRERLRQQLQARLRKQPILETRIDPDLIAGVVVRVGDWVYDASVRTQFSKIRNQLIERSSHEIQSGRDRFSNQ